MSKIKLRKNKKSRPHSKPNRQIPNSLIRKSTLLTPNHYLQNAREYPLHGCWIMANWQDEGITPVVVAREQGPDKIMFGVYLVDLYCLGIKDVVARTDYSLKKFKRELPLLCMNTPKKCTVELAHEIIYGALEYAEKIGFQPHADFKARLADQILDPQDAHLRKNHVSFGKDGKPLFVAGPYDDERKCRLVINTLMRTCGEGNFNYIIGFGGR
ncbi:MAG: hypothetical protein K8R77_00165 [Anaerolineaceae bacterium]|nr:hypothetical protein [Anaerolineaceae bacterium]